MLLTEEQERIRETASGFATRALSGGAGDMRDFGTERICRAVRAGKICEGASDVRRLVIGRARVAATGRGRRGARCS